MNLLIERNGGENSKDSIKSLLIPFTAQDSGIKNKFDQYNLRPVCFIVHYSNNRKSIISFKSMLDIIKQYESGSEYDNIIINVSETKTRSVDSKKSFQILQIDSESKLYMAKDKTNSAIIYFPASIINVSGNNSMIVKCLKEKEDILQQKLKLNQQRNSSKSNKNMLNFDDFLDGVSSEMCGEDDETFDIYNQNP
jgi:hypothetical protein